MRPLSCFNFCRVCRTARTHAAFHLDLGRKLSTSARFCDPRCRHLPRVNLRAIQFDAAFENLLTLAAIFARVARCALRAWQHGSLAALISRRLPRPLRVSAIHFLHIILSSASSAARIAAAPLLFAFWLRLALASLDGPFSVPAPPGQIARGPGCKGRVLETLVLAGQSHFEKSLRFAEFASSQFACAGIEKFARC